MASLADQIDYYPMVSPTLKLIDCQVGKFTATNPTTLQGRHNRSIALTLESQDIRQLPKRTTFSPVSQLPIRTPSLFAPFARLIPKESAASYAKRRTDASMTLIVPGASW
jgi:hypothetical protein